MWKALPGERGSVAVIVALAMAVLLGFAALVVDVGVLYFNRVRLSNAADAAALAGAQELPDNPGQAEALAVSYAVKNGVEAGRASATVLSDGRSIRVGASRTVPLGFARIFGFERSEVGARATARVGVARAVQGAVPFGIVKQDFVYGETYTLKYGAGPSSGQRYGNFGGLALGGRGGCNYRSNIMYGYEGWLRVGDYVETEPGNMCGPTVQGVRYRMSQCNHNPPCTFDHVVRGCPRLVLVPVIDSLEGVHGRDEVLLVGLAAFFLEGVAGRGNDCDVTGRFIRWAVDGELGGAGDYGLVAYRLEE